MENGRQDTGTIILTGYFQSALEEIYEMLTSDIKISMKSIVKAHISQAKEFDQYVAPTVTKCIIAATYTERMNLLIEGSDTGQVTDLFHNAGKMDIFLICVGLPKRQFKQIETTSYIYHQELSALFSTQTLLGDLAKEERFISVLRGGKLDKEQISALNQFINPPQVQHIQHLQFMDKHGGEIAGCHTDHQGDQRYPMNSTEDHDQHETPPNPGIKRMNQDERLDRKEARQIMLTGFDCKFINKACDLLTGDLKVRLSRSLTFINAALFDTYEFDNKVPMHCEKCIIVAPTTTSMNFLSDEDGQFTPLYRKATKRKMDTMLLCMAMPSGGSSASWKKLFPFFFKIFESSHEDSKNTIDNRRLYHTALDELSKTQPLLKELADRNKLISLSKDEHLNKSQIGAVKSFIGFNCSE